MEVIILPSNNSELENDVNKDTITNTISDTIVPNYISNELKEIVSVLKDNICCGMYNDTMKKQILSCKFEKYEKIFNFLTDQISVNDIDPTYSIYKINLFTNKVSHHCDITENIGNNHYATIRGNEHFLFFHCLSMESLLMFLTNNTINLGNDKFKKYVFMPFVFLSELTTIGHFSLIIFDVIDKQVYFADPNGTTSFFNNIFYDIAKTQTKSMSSSTTDSMLNFYPDMFDDMYVDSELIVETVIEHYINKLNECAGYEYKFIKRNQWNPIGYTINKSYEGTYIGSGHCVAIGTLIANYCQIKKCNPIEIYTLLSKLSKSEIIELINSYSIGMYNILIYV